MALRPRAAGMSGSKMTWQAEQSAQTREKLLDATLDSLADLGYFETTISTIAAFAGVSRSSIRYHFRSKAEIIVATISYLSERRLEAYRASLFDESREVDSLDRITEAFWRQVTDRKFAVQQELVVASRTDCGLNAALRPALEMLDAHWLALTLERFPHRRQLGDQLPLVMSVFSLLLEGMAYRRIAGSVSDELIQAMLDFVKRSVRRLIKGEDEPVPSASAMSQSASIGSAKYCVPAAT